MNADKKARAVSKDELSLLLYLETCAVDYGGSIEQRRMNEDDFNVLDKWAESGFVKFGRIYSKDLMQMSKNDRPATHWVELSEDAWKAAHEERRARHKRMSNKRLWRKTDEK